MPKDRAFIPKRVTVRVPGTTSNLGPGFDTLGLALQIYNHVDVVLTQAPGVEIISPIDDADRKSACTMLIEAAALFFQHSKKSRCGIRVSLAGDVPMARGLGSSVTARLGVVAGLNALSDAKLSLQEIFNIVAELEHHPDNAAPAIFGGFNAAGMFSGGARTFTIPVSPRVTFVTLVPEFQVSTERARKLVPTNFSKADTILNTNRTALITAAFAQKNYNALRGLFEDRIHQPYRQKLIPPLFDVIHAGVAAGAIGGWLSGSGSTIMCLALEDPEGVGEAMQRVIPQSQVLLLHADNHGLKVGAVKRHED